MMTENEDRPEGPPAQPVRDEARDSRTGSSASAARMREQARWVDLQVQRAIERGDFDNLPGAGKPLPPLDDDPNWWLKKLIERERITGVLPEALQLRKDDAELDALLDRQGSEAVVRDVLETFNRRVVNARRQLQGGPPVITPTRDIEAEVAAWRERRRRR
jgi:hypothetical protein